jgi:hypothetical protein
MSHQEGSSSSPAGRLIRFIGSVKFAVPALACVAVAMMWGTWVDSTEGASVAAEKVYGSWWFIALMLLICASLIISVAVRYPWRRKHVGFIIVHASLVSLIAIGFFTMFTKIEGRMVLEEGQTKGHMTLDFNWVELVEHTDQGIMSLDFAMVEETGEVSLGDDTIVVTKIWVNSEEVTDILNDSEDPLHAVEIVSRPGQAAGDWVGEVQADQPAPRLDDFAIRVVPTGESWTPPTDGPRVVCIDAAGTEHALPEVGQVLGESEWTLTSVEHFERATIGAGSTITERDSGPANPAVRLVLTHTDGTVEEQMAFERFRDSPFIQPPEAASGFSLTYRGGSFTEPTLAVMRDADGNVRAIYAAPGAETVSYQNDGQWPWTFTVAELPVTIVRDFDRARASTTLEERPMADPSRPVIFVTTGNGAEEVDLRWNSPTPVTIGDRTIMLRYGAATMRLPFALQLKDFRQTVYPGSQMAMAYESDVLVTTQGRDEFEFRVYMNHPYKQDGWKVYQSSFIGDSVTVFQITKDPGLVPTYLFCITLCVGILVTFYSRSLSWGHPDIPNAFPSTSNESS